jgi:osmotically-inducible protein OsmY
MRTIALFLTLLMLSGCTALMVGGGTDGYQHRKDDRPASVVTSDGSITTRIKGKFAADSMVSVFDVGVRSFRGTVTLTGSVGSYVARDRAHALAKGTDGVVAVNNQIVIEDRSQ